MRAAEIFEVDNFTFVEPSFSSLTDTGYNALLASGEWDEGRLLLDEHEDPVAVAFHESAGWMGGSFLCRNPSVAIIERFEQVNGEIFQEDRKTWAAAVREYFSEKLQLETPPSIDDLNPVRTGILSAVITGSWGRGSGDTCIDCGCGSGVGASVLRELGYAPLSYDNDPNLIARGLETHRLMPEETMCLDATIASAYIDPVPRGIGVMMGEINSFSQEMWEQIVSELFSVTNETLITVGTENEAKLIRAWGDVQGRNVDVQESPGDLFYDHWVCIAHKKSM
ncbi:MAG: hypothetical protein NTV84_05865 [Methanoregula sp.]|nr:hypothetical protein [Methanoregula sp.]